MWTSARLLLLLLPKALTAQAAAPQNPSPMSESSRVHERLAMRILDGTRAQLAGPNGTDAEFFIARSAQSARTIDLVIHFHGAAWLPAQAVALQRDKSASLVLNLGAGSGVYTRAFSDPSTFDSLLARAERALTPVAPQARLGRIVLVGFSAGHGAIRAILREPRHVERVSAVILLDGMHTSYLPEGKVLAEGGVLDTTNLTALAAFARAAVNGDKRMLITHSEIFPGTFASTTETADWLLASLGLRRTPVLRWGPRGMQQLSEVRRGGFELLGYAGNSAPDHVDHFHALPEMLARVTRR